MNRLTEAGNSRMPADAENEGFAYKPLYARVKDRLVRRLIDGEWSPGQLIPSEFEIAREIGVSQGTVRKALDAMTTENLLVRQQGRGTYVAQPEDSRLMFQFFRLAPDSGDRTFPTSKVLSWKPDRASDDESAALGLAADAEVVRIERIRLIGDLPAIAETIALPKARFPGFGETGEIPNNVYRLYSERWGITIARATERLKAISASHDDAAALACPRGQPLLLISRVAFDLEGNPVEYRVSRCLTEHAHYVADLR